MLCFMYSNLIYELTLVLIFHVVWSQFCAITLLHRRRGKFQTKEKVIFSLLRATANVPYHMVEVGHRESSLKRCWILTKKKKKKKTCCEHWLS